MRFDYNGKHVLWMWPGDVGSKQVCRGDVRRMTSTWCQELLDLQLAELENAVSFLEMSGFFYIYTLENTAHFPDAVGTISIVSDNYFFF